MPECPVCGAESEDCYACSECGKLFDADDGSDGERARAGGVN